MEEKVLGLMSHNSLRLESMGPSASMHAGKFVRVNMIAEQMAAKLRCAATSVLEMMFTAPVLADQEFLPCGLIGLQFVDEVRGTFTLGVSAPTASLLARNFMGMGAGEHLDANG